MRKGGLKGIDFNLIFTEAQAEIYTMNMIKGRCAENFVSKCLASIMLVLSEWREERERERKEEKHKFV